MIPTFSFEDKLSRASYHLSKLDTRIRRWLATDAYRLVDERDLFSGEQVVSIDPLKPFPKQVALLIGDYLYNLRSALEHFAYSLAVGVRGEPLPDTIARTSEFPIFAEAKYASQLTRKTGGIAQEARDIIEGLQPYHAGHRARSHPLWLLHELSNMDKHRAPNLAVAAHMGTQPELPFESYIAKFTSGGVIKHKTEVVRHRVRGHRKVHFGIDVDLVFAQEPCFGRPVLGTLTNLCEFVTEQVIPPFRKFLPAR